jgi:hypothetical protein
MLIAGINIATVAGLRHRAAMLRRLRDDRVEEDPICQAEEGVVQAASGVRAVASVALLFIRCLRRRRRRR